MHPELVRELVDAQLEEAREAGLLGGAVALDGDAFPDLYFRFANTKGRIRLFRFEYSDYDTQPMLMEPVDPETREQLADADWVRRNGSDFPRHPMLEGRQFLCIDANRLYYTFPGHLPQATGMRWEAVRADRELKDVLAFIAEKFASGVWE